MKSKCPFHLCFSVKHSLLEKEYPSGDTLCVKKHMWLCVYNVISFYFYIYSIVMCIHTVLQFAVFTYYVLKIHAYQLLEELWPFFLNAACILLFWCPVIDLCSVLLIDISLWYIAVAYSAAMNILARVER